MAEEQAIIYAPQWENMNVENVSFQTNNVVGNFNYLPEVLAYKPIMKFLMNCPLKQAFTKCPSLMPIAYDPSPPTNATVAHPLKEFLIKFLVINDTKPLIIDFKTFCSSTGLDYNKGKYVAHLSPEAVKKELAKIVTNASYLDKTPVLKISFLVAWRILFTFVIQVLGENYSSTEQINYIQQMIAYYLITRTEVDIGEIIYKELLGPEYTQDENFGNLPGILSNSNFSKDPSKVTDIELTIHIVVGLETSGALSKKRKQPKPKKTHSEAKPADTGLSSTVPDEDTTRTMTRPKCPLGDKDSKGSKPLVDMEPINPTIAALSGTGVEYQVYETQSTRLRYQALTNTEGKTSFEEDPDTETLPLTTIVDIQAYLLSDDDLLQESDEEVFTAGDDMDADPKADEEVQSLQPTQDKPKSSPFQETDDYDLSSYLVALRKYDNTLPLTERQLQVEAATSYADLKLGLDDIINTSFTKYENNDAALRNFQRLIDLFKSDHNTSMRRILDNLDEVQNVVKEDHALNRKVIEATEAYTKNFSSLTELLNLVKGLDFPGFKAVVADLQALVLRQ
ncbi:hypothetical protein Tco_0877325 [Tanacetum coccineum]|uniref:Uncharacterized protein n=1 Tax=Tanacetum coccineum TaxID=301880 RepID=A0ABQ5BWK3_9ASTR